MAGCRFSLIERPDRPVGGLKDEFEPRGGGGVGGVDGGPI
jgi:hypothetical protein